MYDGTPCIEDHRCPTHDGYSRCQVRRFGRLVNLRHRLAWIDANGMLPPDDKPLILHHCDNPPCVNPLHLYAGTQADNIRDMCTRGRARLTSGRGRNHTCGIERSNHKLTDEAVRVARQDYAVGVGVTALARRYVVSRSAMQAALDRKTWAHVA